MPVLEYFGREPKLSAIFNNAMTAWSAPAVAAALKAYDFGGIGVLVDVAGGHGHVLTSILRAYPMRDGNGRLLHRRPSGRRRLHHEEHHP